VRKRSKFYPGGEGSLKVRVRKKKTAPKRKEGFRVLASSAKKGLVNKCQPFWFQTPKQIPSCQRAAYMIS